MTLRFRSQGLHEKPSARRQQIYEGDEKVLFAGPDPGTCVLYFKDQSRYAPDLVIPGKGVINNRLSELFMRRLADIGIPNHYIRQLNMREQLVRATELIPLRLEVHNVAAGGLVKRLGLEEGYRLNRPIVDMQYKSKELSYPFVSPSHALSLGWATEEEMDEMLSCAQRVNDFLQGQFLAVGISLLSLQLEFGRFYIPEFGDGCQVLMIDEISPDTCCLWDIESHRILDATVCQTEPNVYQEVARRFGILEAVT